MASRGRRAGSAGSGGTGAKPAGVKPAGSKPVGGKPVGAKPVGAKPVGAKPGSAKVAASVNARTTAAVGAARDTLRARGRAVMAEVLGDPYVARRDASTTSFNAPVRRLSEEFAYATLWTREGLSRRERSLVTIGMLCALNRPHELRIHLAGAINNGCTADEIREVFTHGVAYCGFPAAIDALRVGEEVLREHGLLEG